MSADRLRRGELVVLGGLLLLVVSVFLKWFSIDRVDSNSRGVTVTVFGSASSGWGYLGSFWILILLVAAVAGLAAVVLAARSGPGRPTYGAVSAAVLGSFASGVILLLMLIRVLLARPTPSANDLGSDAIVSAQAVSGSLVDLARAEAQLSLAAGAWFGLLGLLLLTVGLWMAMADDRTGASESATAPPPVSVVPPMKPPLPPAPAPVSDPAPDPEPAPTVPESVPAPEPASEPAPVFDEAPEASAPAETLPSRTFRPPGAGPDDDPPPTTPDRP